MCLLKWIKGLFSKEEPKSKNIKTKNSSKSVQISGDKNLTNNFTKIRTMITQNYILLPTLIK